MKNYSIFAFVVTLAGIFFGNLVADNTPDNVAGQPIYREDILPPPYLVAINEKIPGGHKILHCSGTLISPNQVLVDYDCLDYYGLLEVAAGVYDISTMTEESRQVRSIKSTLGHPYEQIFENDDRYRVRIIEVDPPFQINEHVQPAVISTSRMGNETNYSSYCVYSGWGTIYPKNALQYFERRFEFIGEDECRDALKGLGRYGFNAVLRNCYLPLKPESDDLSRLIKARGGPLVCAGEVTAQGRMESFGPGVFYPRMFETRPLIPWLKTLGVFEVNENELPVNERY